MRALFLLWEQFIGPSLKAMRTLVIRPLQGYGNTAPISSPDTWVRKPDCLRVPYTILSCNCRISNLPFKKAQKIFLGVTLPVRLCTCSLTPTTPLPAPGPCICSSSL